MPFVQWGKDMSVGVEALDEDHRCLFDMVNELYDAVQNGTADTLMASVFDRLESYIRDHFAREEALMAEGGFPDLTAHRAEHIELAAKVHDLRRRVLDGSLDRPGLELLVLFKTWLTSHIRITDNRYRPYVVAASGTSSDGDGSRRNVA